MRRCGGGIRAPTEKIMKHATTIKNVEEEASTISMDLR